MSHPEEEPIRRRWNRRSAWCIELALRQSSLLIMAAEKILFLFVIVAATPLAHTRSRWSNDRVFPDDYEWGLHLEAKVSHQSENEVDAPVGEVCQTEECRKIASSFVGSMDKSADPCEDFYQFTCGRYEANNPILPSNVDSNPLQMYQDLVHRRISEILEKEPDSDDILPVKQAKKWYRSCMDTENLETVGITPIESFATEVGGWPIAMRNGAWDSEDYPWQDVESYYARLTGHNAFYDVIGGPSSDGSKIGELAIMEPELFTERMQLMHSPAYLTFLGYAVGSFANHNGVGLSPNDYAKEALELVVFESKLMQLIVTKRSDDPTEWVASAMTFDEFVDWYESNTTKTPRARIHWQSAVQNLFDPLNVKVNRKSTTYVRNIGYIRGLGTLLKKTKLRTIVNYIHWNYIADMLSHTTERMRDEIFKAGVMHLSFGVKQRAPRWEECVKEMKMTYTAAYVFTEKYFPKSTQIAAHEMMENIKIGLEANIDHSNWLDGKSKSLAKEKLEAMKIFTGYPEWYNNATAITEYYKGLTIDTEYLDNALSYMRFERRAKLLPYTMTEDEDNPTSMSPITVNAEYNEEANALNAPPAVFQSPLFTPGLPNNVNYGQVGFLVGHEMGHGFDDTGIRHGKDGNESELTINILKSYYQRAHCFVDQFDSYFGVTEEPEQGVGVTLEFDDLGDTRGSNTKSENIADSTGLQALFQAYRNLNKKTRRAEPKLPGLESFTDEQLFFIAFGAYWCGSETPEYTAITADDPHSPGNLRVNGAVSNTNDFAEVFACPAGSAMNPSDKCSIWDKSGSKPKSSASKRMKKYHSHWINQWKN